MGEHTAGPWYLDTRLLRDGHIAVLAEDYGVAKVWSVDKVERSTHEANARLIAAAPDLLEALRDLLSYATQLEIVTYAEDDCAESAIVARARAAIAKATAASLPLAEEAGG